MVSLESSSHAPVRTIPMPPTRVVLKDGGTEQDRFHTLHNMSTTLPIRRLNRLLRLLHLGFNMKMRLPTTIVLPAGQRDTQNCISRQATITLSRIQIQSMMDNNILHPQQSSMTRVLASQTMQRIILSSTRLSLVQENGSRGTLEFVHHPLQMAIGTDTLRKPCSRTTFQSL